MDFNFLNQNKDNKNKGKEGDKGKKGKNEPKFFGSIFSAVLIFMLITALYLVISGDSVKKEVQVPLSVLAKSVSVGEVKKILVEGEKNVYGIGRYCN